VALLDKVIRYPYRVGDQVARGEAEVIVPALAPDPKGGHRTRDLVFSNDGKRLFVSIGSSSNVATDMPAEPPGGLESWKTSRALGEAWGHEDHRADVQAFDPEGKSAKVFATGLRNCVGIAVHPLTGDVWCAVNERDDLGDDLVPDYVTRVKEGAFYGWPWFYLGAHPDPRLAGRRDDLRTRLTVPDVLVQPHSAALQLAFYTGTQFPTEYQGDAFVAFHGSWNRSYRTGYKIERVRLQNGIPTGEVEDFVTGFVVDNQKVWGRPVGVGVAQDGSLLFTEDGNGTIWRVTHPGK
jgi:glucose/arabinose dehydrogenase